MLPNRTQGVLHFGETPATQLLTALDLQLLHSLEPGGDERFHGSVRWTPQGVVAKARRTVQTIATCEKGAREMG